MDTLTEPQVAELLGVTQRTMQRWRKAGRDLPAHTKIGRHVVYDREDVEAWVAVQFTPRFRPQN